MSGTAALAIGAGLLAAWDPQLFPLILVINLWLLGYHHVIATFTRLTFDRESFDQYRFLALGVPVLVVAGVLLVIGTLGSWAVASTYLYWQWFHYTRQSYGIEQIYWRKAGGARDRRDRATWALIYLVPLWGILQRSAEQQPKFLGMDIWYVPVPPVVLDVAAAAGIAAMALWGVMRLWELGNGRLRVAHSLYVLSHTAVFGMGYLVIAHIDYGWLAINVWHNAQYLFIVWMYNTNRFKQGVDPNHRFLSAISQPNRVAIYLAVCLGVTTIVYSGVRWLVPALAFTGIPVAVVIYQTINFHHYIVDGVIWKLRRPAVGSRVGLAAG